MIPAIIASVVPPVVRLVESAFSKKPKSGSEKFDTALSVVLAIYSALEKGGLVSKRADDTPEIRAAIEAAVQSLKQAGVLGGPVVGKRVMFDGVMREVE